MRTKSSPDFVQVLGSNKREKMHFWYIKYETTKVAKGKEKRASNLKGVLALGW